MKNSLPKIRIWRAPKGSGLQDKLLLEQYDTDSDRLNTIELTNRQVVKLIEKLTRAMLPLSAQVYKRPQ